MVNAGTAGWGEDWERLAAQMREAIRPIQQIQLDFARQLAPIVKVQEDMQGAFQAIAQQTAIPSERFRELFAAISDAAKMPKLTLPEGLFGEGLRPPLADLEPFFEQLRTISLAHRELGLRLSESGAAFLEEGFEGLDAIAEEPPEDWTVETLRWAVEFAGRYYRALILMVGILFTGMVMTSREVGVHPDAMVVLEQMRDTAVLISMGAALLAELDRRKD